MKLKPSFKRKLTTRTLQEKYAAIIDIEENGKTRTEVAQAYRVPLNTLSTWLTQENKTKIKEKYLSASFSSKTKRMRTGKYHDLEEALMKWVVQARKNHSPVNGPILEGRANSLAKMMGIGEFKSSPSWVMRFRRRHGLGYKGRKQANDERKPSMAAGDFNQAVKTEPGITQDDTTLESILSQDDMQQPPCIKDEEIAGLMAGGSHDESNDESNSETHDETHAVNVQSGSGDFSPLPFPMAERGMLCFSPGGENDPVSVQHGTHPVANEHSVETISIPSKEEALQCIIKLKLFLQSKKEAQEHMKGLVNIEGFIKDKRQSTIDTFFRPI